MVVRARAYDDARTMLQFLCVRLFRTVGWISVLLLIVYLLNAYVPFRFGG